MLQLVVLPCAAEAGWDVRGERMTTATRIAATGLVMALVAWDPHLLGETQRRGETAARPVGETVRIAGLECSVWTPAGGGGRVPLVIFSHGFHGNRNQSTF